MNSEEPTHSIMVDFSTILVLGVEGVGLVLYAIIMWILGAARSNSLRTQFYTQSWILGFFDISCYLGNVLLREVRDANCDISIIYLTMVFTKMVTNGHQLTMIWLNICRFQIFYRPMASSHETSRSTFRYRWRWATVLIFLGFSLSAYRLVLIGLIGWPDLNYNYPGQLLMVFIRTGTVGILLFPCLFCAILNIGCFWKLQHNTRSIMSNSQKRRNLRMLIYAGLVIIAAFPITAYQSLKFYGTMVGAKQFTADVTQFFDLCYLPFLFGSPVILLAMSVEVRKEFLNVITCRWRSTAGDLSDKGEITAVQGVLTQFSMPPKLSVNSIVPLRI